MNQIHLFCPHCSATLNSSETKEQSVLLALCYCVFCGGILIMSDLNLPKYRVDLIERTQIEIEIRRICALTGKSVGFVEQFVSEAKMSAVDLKRLVEKIALGEWKFEDEN